MTEKLIEMVKLYPILFDLSNEEYKNIRKKDKIWKDIGEELNESGDEIKKKWKNLRDGFARYLRGAKTTTGQAAKSGRKWQWATQMEFFIPFLKLAKTSSNVSSVPVPDEDIFQLTDSQSCEEIYPSANVNFISALESMPSQQHFNPPHSTPTPAKKRKGNEEKPGSSVDSLINYFESKKKKEMHEVDLMFSAFAQTVKQFSKRRQARTKMLVSQIITEQELGHVEEQEIFTEDQLNNSSSIEPDYNIEYIDEDLSPRASN